MPELTLDRSVGGPGPDTSEMVAVHEVFRTAFGESTHLVGSVPAGDVARAQVVGSYYANVLELLHRHHAGEDELLWPRLLERAANDADTISRIAAQHRDVEDAFERAATLLRAWEVTADTALGDNLATALGQLLETLDVHLRDEETEILPLVAEHITLAEWGELPAHAMQHYAGDKPWLALGLVREQLTDEQREAMLAQLPPPARDGWLQHGEPAYVAFMAELAARG